MRITLIGLVFLALTGCTESAADKAAAARTDAADPGDRPYPNLGAFPAVPARAPVGRLADEQQRLEGQRDAARAFDARLRVIDPVLDPGARPPEPPAFASPATAPASAPVPAAPVAVPPVQPVAAAVPPHVAAVPPATVAAPAPVVPAARPTRQVPAAGPVAPAAGPRTGWFVGDIDFADGSAILSREARRTLRDAVVAAQDRGGRVRITPSAGAMLSPPEQALSPRRAAAAAGELEALGLDRARIAIDPGALRAARVAVEF